jgi:signal transduction histidine kinase
MIKDLRRKFILLNMLLVFLVLVVVFTALCVSSHRQAERESLTALQFALNRRDDQRPAPFYVGQRPPNDFARSPVFVLQIKEDGAPILLLADNISVAGADLSRIAEAVMASAENGGVLRNYNLRFMKKTERGRTKAAFIEISAEQAALKRAFIVSFISLFAALLAFFFISLFLSKWIFRPAELAWKQQRRFVSDASHELKTPLTVILANMNILKNNRADTVEDQWNWIENTETEAKRMKGLVDNLLFLAKSDDAKSPVAHTEVNLSDIVLSAVLAFESLAFERNVSLNTDRLTPGIYVKGDESQLYRLVAILLDNAVKYSDEGGVVRVSLETGQTKAALSVANNGAPIARADAAHLFERFYRADRARTTDGYGLGLAIAKNVAELHHGKISAESDAENGTIFTVFLQEAKNKMLSFKNKND